MAGVPLTVNSDLIVMVHQGGRLNRVVAIYVAVQLSHEVINYSLRHSVKGIAW